MKVSSGSVHRRVCHWWWMHHVPPFQLQPSSSQMHSAASVKNNSCIRQLYCGSFGNKYVAACGNTQRACSTIHSPTVRRPVRGSTCEPSEPTDLLPQISPGIQCSSPLVTPSFTSSNTAAVPRNSVGSCAHLLSSAAVTDVPRGNTENTQNAFTRSEVAALQSRTARPLRSFFSTVVGNSISRSNCGSTGSVRVRESIFANDGPPDLHKARLIPAEPVIHGPNDGSYSPTVRNEVRSQTGGLLRRTPLYTPPSTRKALVVESVANVCDALGSPLWSCVPAVKLHLLRNTLAGAQSASMLLRETWQSQQAYRVSAAMLGPLRNRRAGAQSASPLSGDSWQRDGTPSHRQRWSRNSERKTYTSLPFIMYAARGFFLAKSAKSDSNNATSDPAAGANPRRQSSYTAKPVTPTSVEEASNVSAAESKEGKDAADTARSADEGSTNSGKGAASWRTKWRLLPGETATIKDDASQLKIAEEEQQLAQTTSSTRAFPFYQSPSARKHRNEADSQPDAGSVATEKGKAKSKPGKVPLSKKLISFIFGFLLASGCSFFIMYCQVADATLVLQQIAKDATHRLAILESRIADLEHRVQS